MTYFVWNNDKNEKLKHQRKIGFKDIIFAINNGHLLATAKHPNKKRYKNQKLLIVNINNYAYLVPFVKNQSEIFLKTIIPSRKATKKYLRSKK